MNLPPDEFPSEEPELPDGDPPADMHHQQFQLSGVTARVPSTIGHGIFSTGAIVMTVRYAFVLDFLQQMGVPASLVTRIVIPHPVMPQFIQALEHNIDLYQQKFGTIPSMPKPPQPNRRPTVQEIYENLKMSDDQLPGHYADGVIIRHSPAEFCFDFVTHFYPHASVAQRVFFSAPHVPQLLLTMRANFERFRDGPNQPPSPPEKEEE